MAAKKSPKKSAAKAVKKGKTGRGGGVTVRGMAAGAKAAGIKGMGTGW